MIHARSAPDTVKVGACGKHTRWKRDHKTTKRSVISARVREDHLKRKTASEPRRFGQGGLAAQGIVMDRTAVSRIENQSRYAMDYEAAAIARALKVSVAWLFGETR